MSRRAAYRVLVRRVRFLPLALAATVLAFGSASAQERTQLTAEVGGQPIVVHFYRPAGPGPFPLLVLSHGSPARADRRGEVGPNTLRRQAEAFRADDIAVAVPIRRGYGGRGRWAEGYGSCEDPDFVRAGAGTAEDIRAAIGVAAAQPGIDRSRIVLVGQSAGGWGSLAASREGGILAVVNFAGGRGAQESGLCSPDRLVAAAAAIGRESRLPTLWIYSRNDRSFGPDLVERMHRAFIDAGGRAELVLVEPYGDDGHRFIRAIPAWKARVGGFLRRVGFLR